MILTKRHRYDFLIPTLLFLFIAIINAQGCISYAYTLAFFLILNAFTDKEYQHRNYLAFNFFIFIALAVYTINRLQFPTQMGLTGGATQSWDDGQYYMAATDNRHVPIKSPEEVENDDFFIQVVKLFYPFVINDPITLVIFNVLIGLAFLPYFTAKVAEELFKDRNISELAFKLIQFCPFCLAIGSLILRDIPGALLIIMAYYCFLKKRYLFLIAITSVLFFLKFGFVVFLAVAILCDLFLKKKLRFNFRTISLIGLAVVIVYAAYIYVIPNLASITGDKLQDGTITREHFLEFIARENEDSFMVKIHSWPIYIQIPGLIASFIIMPLAHDFLGYDSVIKMSTPKSFLFFLAPLYMVYWMRYFFGVMADFFKVNQRAKEVFVIVLLLALSLGTISIQIRHRVVLMPFLYIVIAYGYKKVHCGVVATIFQILLLLANVVYAFIL